MAATKEVLDLTERIFNEAHLALNDSYPDRVRQLGDSSCKAGIGAVIRFLSGKSELSDDELQTLVLEVFRELQSLESDAASVVEAKETGADKLLIACPKCLIHFQCAGDEKVPVAKDQVDIPMEDFAAFIARYLE